MMLLMMTMTMMIVIILGGRPTKEDIECTKPPS